MKKIGVVIVSYNTCDYLEKCLRSIEKYLTRWDCEVVVVDNNSSDGSVRMVRTKFPKVKLVASDRNNYFCRANNLGWKRTKAGYIVFMNPDIELVDNSFDRIFSYMDKNQEVAAMEPAQYDGDGKILATGTRKRELVTDILHLTGVGRFGGKKLLHKFLMMDKDRRHLLVKTGGFSQNIKMYFSEDALCERLSRYGKIIHFGTSRVKHYLSRSTNKITGSKINSWFARDGYYLYKSRGKELAGAFLYSLIIGSYWLKVVMGRIN
jgi:hypothetical protein